MTPRGLGIYCGRVASVASAVSTGRLIERLRRARARHVALCTEGTDGWRPTREQLAPVAERLASADLAVHVFSLPGEARARLGARVAHDVLELVRGLPISSIQLDAEEAYRGRPAELDAAVDALIDGVTEATAIGITSYGLPSEGGAFPWASILGRGYLVWQAYERAGKATRARRGLDELRQSWGRDVVPAVAAYQRRTSPAGEHADGAARLRADLERACRDPATGRVDVVGAWVWSDGSLDARELDELGAWVQAAGWLR